MLKKNTGSNEHDILQNQFTAFVTVAVSNARIDYLRVRIRRLQRELITEEYEILFSEDCDYIEVLSENDTLHQAIQMIKEKERYRFESHIPIDKFRQEYNRFGFQGAITLYLKNLLLV